MLADTILIPPRPSIPPTNNKKVRGPQKGTETSNRMLTKFVSIGRYSHEVIAFGTLITSTKVFSLIICKTLRPHPQNDPLPRDLRLRT